jgi:hypothetical protein
MDTPGPFEKKATQAYYYVTPVEENWTEKQKNEWLTSFNYYTTDVVSIHEAYPGHYVQFLHLTASPATNVEKIFGSYALYRRLGTLHRENDARRRLRQRAESDPGAKSSGRKVSHGTSR